MSDTNHTQWRVGGRPKDNSGTDWREVLAHSPIFGDLYVCQALSKDAAFIVRACNSHNALVEALEAAKLISENYRNYLASWAFPLELEGFDIEANKITAALALAKGESV